LAVTGISSVCSTSKAHWTRLEVGMSESSKGIGLEPLSPAGPCIARYSCTITGTSTLSSHSFRTGSIFLPRSMSLCRQLPPTGHRLAFRGACTCAAVLTMLGTAKALSKHRYVNHFRPRAAHVAGGGHVAHAEAITRTTNNRRPSLQSLSSAHPAGPLPL
jgi:hypothetical protein